MKANSAVLVGYGKEGQSVHRFLLARGICNTVAIADQHPVKPVAPTAEIFTGPSYLDHLGEYDLLVRSPGIPPDLPELRKAVNAGTRITSATNLFFEYCPGLTVGITGTKGKSTTSSLIAAILSQKFPDVRLVGNIGRPALDYLEEEGNAPPVFVIELSSQQLVDIVYSPKVAVLLNIVPEHLDFHGNFSNYLSAKGNILAYQDSSDTVVFNPTHSVSQELATVAPSTQFRFAPEKSGGLDCYLDSGWVVGRNNSRDIVRILPVEEIPLLGPGNLENVLAAASVGLLLEVEASAIRTAIKSFHPLPHRLEFVGENRGIRFYNDSLATIPEATITALEALGTEVATLIAGGYDRQLDYSGLARYLLSTSIRSLILFSPSGDRLWQAITEAAGGDKVEITKFEVTSMEEAVAIAREDTPPGKICLLSPAAASYGLFKDYAERGERFKKLALSD